MGSIVRRRDLLKMFCVAPAIILTPNLLMPVKTMKPGNGCYKNLVDMKGRRIERHLSDLENALFYGSAERILVTRAEWKNNGLAGRYS